MKYVLALSLALTCPALANVVGNDTENFNPTASGLDFVTVESSQLLSPGLFSAGFFVNTAKNSLPDTVTNLGERIPARSSITFGDLILGYGFSKRIEFGLTVSYLLSQDTERTMSGGQYAATGLDDIRVGAKTSLLRRETWGLALASSLGFNQVQRNPFVGNGAGPTLNVQAVGDYKIGRVHLGANLGYRLRANGSRIENAVYEPIPDQVIGSLGASYYLPSWDTKFIAEVFGSKVVRSTTYVDSGRVASEYVVGAKYDVASHLAINFGGGSRLGTGLFTPDWRVYGGLILSTGVAVPPMPVAGPPAQVEVSVYKGYQPRDIEALVPVAFDDISAHHEFILRRSIPEADLAGVKPPFEVIRLDGFGFDTASATIKPEFKPMLDKLAAYIASAPAVLKVRVEGHTDSMGARDRNLRLSQRRADALRDYLAPKVQAPIEPAGFGQERPIADNGNYQGRAQNRRVEIRILRSLPEPKGDRIEAR